MSRNVALSVAVAALLFLFTFAHARAPLDQPENDVTSRDDRLADLPESDPKATATIVLPSEKPESKSANVVKLESEETESTESKLPGKEIGTSESFHEKSETETTVTVPLTLITFRPINRHFLRRPLIPFRRGHRCRGRYQHHNQLKPWGGLRFKSPREVYFGNDMILSGGKDLGLAGPRQIPVRWTRFNHGGNRFSFVNDESRREEMIKRPHHHQHHRHHHEEEEEGEEREHEGAFMKGIRKFLNHF
ncbi:hypothetical protein P3X46_016823 [Hevea brasiliensis]|uniref:Uncharacterized protein n=1 Tax=Hevea brasiliensis TaxID=3981 RepID=A0ABQ9M229_HEVBR|nr:uncharacterized protein LOC110671537 [Hevea brasiliensis]KAJ9173713.1 hypothetical protein P3X46_016823 [Hevea brasiliensis]